MIVKVLYIEVVCLKHSLKKPVISKISRIYPNYRYVDVIPTLVKMQIP